MRRHYCIGEELGHEDKNHQIRSRTWDTEDHKSYILYRLEDGVYQGRQLSDSSTGIVILLRKAILANDIIN
jgi:hypothetical protein